MTDALAARSAREHCIELARQHFKLRDFLLVAASAVIFVLALVRGGHWLWWIAGFPPIAFVALLAGWLFYLVWLPRRAVARLSRLPHRRVTLEISDAGFAFATAVERLELAWSELKKLQRLPSFWLFSSEAGAEIPVPVDAVSPEQLAFIQARVGGAAGSRAS